MALRFGLLGTGYWAQETHGAALATSEDAEFVGVWGRNPAKAEAVAGRFGVRGFADLDELLREVDAVAIALPPDVQADLAVRAAVAGRHLLLDKPLALSVESARRVVDAAAAGDVASVVFFTSRFRPEVAAWLRGRRRRRLARRPRHLVRFDLLRGQPVRRLRLAAAEGWAVGRRPARTLAGAPAARARRARHRRERPRRHGPPGARPSRRRVVHRVPQPHRAGGRGDHGVHRLRPTRAVGHAPRRDRRGGGVRRGDPAAQRRG